MPARIVNPARDAASNAAAYREQIADWARCLATGSIDALQDAIAGDQGVERMIAFIDGAYAKRMDWLKSAVEFVVPTFEDIDALVEDYVNTAPPAAIGANVDDADAFLEWLETTQDLSLRQQEYVTCQRARHAVESMALGNRLGHLRFQEISSLASRFADELIDDDDAAGRLTIELNPIYAWVTIQTAELLEQPTAAPVEVIFFAVDEGISTAEFSTAAADLVRELQTHGPWTLETWSRVNATVDAAELKAFVATLARIGLAALT